MITYGNSSTYRYATKSTNNLKWLMVVQRQSHHPTPSPSAKDACPHHTSARISPMTMSHYLRKSLSHAMQWVISSQRSKCPGRTHTPLHAQSQIKGGVPITRCASQRHILQWWQPDTAIIEIPHIPRTIYDLTFRPYMKQGALPCIILKKDYQLIQNRWKSHDLQRTCQV